VTCANHDPNGQGSRPAPAPHTPGRSAFRPGVCRVYTRVMTKHIRAIITALAIAVVGLLPSCRPVEASYGGCTSYKFSNSQARGYCTTLNGGDFAREWAVCRNAFTGAVKDVSGQAVYSAWTESVAYCVYPWQVARHHLAVWDV
jgi:hypothetical protein